MALADPAVSAKDGTAPVTRDTQGPPPHLGMTGFSISPPGARSCRVSSTAVLVCLGRGPGVHAHTRVRTLACTPGRAVNSLPHPVCQMEPRCGAWGAWGRGGWRGGGLLTLILI